MPNIFSSCSLNNITKTSIAFAYKSHGEEDRLSELIWPTMSFVFLIWHHLFKNSFALLFSSEVVPKTKIS